MAGKKKAEYRVGKINDRLVTAKALGHDNGAAIAVLARHIFGESLAIACKHGRLRATEAVDALFDVPYHKAVARGGDCRKGRVLQGIDILIFVNVNGVIFRGNRARRVRRGAIRPYQQVIGGVSDVAEFAQLALGFPLGKRRVIAGQCRVNQA